jgi:hypothetical protein
MLLIAEVHQHFVTLLLLLHVATAANHSSWPFSSHVAGRKFAAAQHANGSNSAYRMAARSFPSIA